MSQLSRQASRPAKYTTKNNSTQQERTRRNSERTIHQPRKPCIQICIQHGRTGPFGKEACSQGQPRVETTWGICFGGKRSGHERPQASVTKHLTSMQQEFKKDAGVRLSPERNDGLTRRPNEDAVEKMEEGRRRSMRYVTSCRALFQAVCPINDLQIATHSCADA